MHDLCLASCDYQSLGAKARSKQVRKIRPRPVPTDILSLGSSRLAELRTLQTEYLFLGATQDRPGQGLAQNTIDLRDLLEQQTLVFLITSKFCPKECFKKLRSIYVASACRTA